MAFDAHRQRGRCRAVPPQRVRRHLVFQRMLCRFALGHGWVLKGGFCLEVRFDLTSRATMDLDLVLRDDVGAAVDVQDKVDRALDQDLGDGFSFRVRQPKSLTLTETGTRTWRMSVGAVLAGRVFESVTLDVATAAAELDGGTEPMDVGLTDPGALGARLASVYLERDGMPPPHRPPTAPAAWTGPYAAMADEAGLDVADLADGVAVAEGLYLEAIGSVNDKQG